LFQIANFPPLPCHERPACTPAHPLITFSIFLCPGVAKTAIAKSLFMKQQLLTMKPSHKRCQRLFEMAQVATDVAQFSKTPAF